MLEDYFTWPECLHRLRRGPLARCMDELATTLEGRGYARSTIRDTLRVASRFSEFAAAAGAKGLRSIDDRLANRFLKRELRRRVRGSQRATTIHRIISLLRARGRIPPAPRQPREPCAALLARYDRHLRDVRGLVPSTRERYLRAGRRLLTWRRRRNSSLRTLRGADVIEFIQQLTREHPVAANVNGSKFGQQLCSETRSFLRYLRWEGIIGSDLSRVVPKVPVWRLASIPRHLPWHDVRKLVDSVDTSRPVGLRDKAIVLLIARLGLRAVEVRTLELGHINWRAGEIRLPRTKNRRERILPLPQDVGAALADYLLRGRARVDLPQVFLRLCAPLGPLTAPGAVGRIITRQLRRAKIQVPNRPGSHLLRHSLATRMINAGTPIKQIADLLGHASIDTTAIYAKVDLRSLTAVALPLPGEGP